MHGCSCPSGFVWSDVLTTTAVITFLKNAVLILVSVLLCTAAAEGMVRWLDAQEPSAALKHLDEIPLAEGVQSAWFGANPPPLPNL